MRGEITEALIGERGCSQPLFEAFEWIGLKCGAGQGEKQCEQRIFEKSEHFVNSRKAGRIENRVGVCDTDGVFSPAGIPAGVTGNCKPTESGNSTAAEPVTIKWGATEGVVFSIPANAMDRFRFGA
ncbi:MAG TPA: hypothetical protein DC058_07930 [Planctomycetaceae bacterium]|nr:hypothetical protein [Planctomycetaceae bacterium]HBC61135.1 hypothetical protein [Planctomycetaceae bacterium]